MNVHLLNHIQLFSTPWTAACQPPLFIKFSRQEYWSRLPFPTPGDLLDPGIETSSLASPALVGGFFATSATWEAYLCVCVCMYTYICVCCIYCFLLIFRKLPIKCVFANYVVMDLVNVQTHLIMGTTIGDSSPTYTERYREVIIQQCSFKVFLWWGGQSLCQWKHANQPHCECLWSIQYWLPFLYLTWGFPDSSVGKKSSCNAGDLGLIPGSGRSAGEGIGYHSIILGLPW